MPGIPYRPKHKAAFIQQIKRDPPNAAILADWSKIKKSEQEGEAFLLALVEGLVLRLDRKDHTNSHILREVIQRAEAFFLYLARIYGIQIAKDSVIHSVSRWSSRDLQRSKKSDPVGLALESIRLLEIMPARSNLANRKAWIISQGMTCAKAEQWANDTNATLAELILAERYAVSQSEIHKTLAKARKLLKNKDG